MFLLADLEQNFGPQRVLKDSDPFFDRDPVTIGL